MKLDIIIVDFALVALVFLPYVLFILMGRREERKLKNRFFKEVLKSQLTIEEKDSWNHTIVALDRDKGKILFVQSRKTGFAVELINLRNIIGCEVLQGVYTVKVGKTAQHILQRIDLQLTLNDKSLRMVNFYNCDENYSQEYEMEHAERWSNQINEFIRFRPTVKSAA